MRCYKAKFALLAYGFVHAYLKFHLRRLNPSLLPPVPPFLPFHAESTKNAFKKSSTGASETRAPTTHAKGCGKASRKTGPSSLLLSVGALRTDIRILSP